MPTYVAFCCHLAFVYSAFATPVIMPPLVNKADELATSLSQLQLGPQRTEPPCLVLYHAACLNHRYTRPDASESATGRQAEAHDAACVERPERLRAVLCGIHAAINRHPGRVSLQTTQASLSLASNLVKAVHGPLQVTNTSDYAHDLQSWLGNVEKQHKTGQSEIPEGYPQGDLYLAAGPDGSQTALEGALGAACQAVDQVCAEPDQGGVRFVAVRPPGHVSLLTLLATPDLKLITSFVLQSTAVETPPVAFASSTQLPSPCSMHMNLTT